MADFSVPSKLVGERFTLTFSFLNRLLWDEEVTSATCTVEVASGTDAEPEEILLGAEVVSADGLSVTQQVQLGVPGVIYKVVCTAITDQTHTYVKASHLAILPDDDAPPVFPFVGQIETVEMTSGA